jgi:hypothetical protein
MREAEVGFRRLSLTRFVATNALGLLLAWLACPGLTWFCAFSGVDGGGGFYAPKGPQRRVLAASRFVLRFAVVLVVCGVSLIVPSLFTRGQNDAQ